MSIVIAIELLQSVGVELAIFALTFVIAAVFRGSPISKKVQKTVTLGQSPLREPLQAETCGGAGGGRFGSAASKRQTNTSPSSAQARVPRDAMCKKIDSLMDCANRRQASDAIAIYEDMRSNGHAGFTDSVRSRKQCPSDVFNVLVQCAGRVGRPELIEVILGDMVLTGIQRSLKFYENTMKILASQKFYKEAMIVYSHLEADGLEPSPVTLSCLINFAVEIGQPDRAICFFKRLAATGMPSIRAYMTILRVHSKRQDWAGALALIREMQHRQAPLDSLVLNMALATGLSAGQLDAAQELLQELSQAGVADVVSYNTVMKGLAQKRDGDKAIQLLDEMTLIGVKPNAITFNTAMDAAVRNVGSRATDAWFVLARMCDAGIAPDKFTCTTLMKGLQHGATAEQITAILDLLRNVVAACDPGLCGSLFRNVIEAAARVNDPSLTARAIAQMQEQRVMLPPQEYQALLQVLMHDGEGKAKRAVCQQAPWKAAQKPYRAFCQPSPLKPVPLRPMSAC